MDRTPSLFLTADTTVLTGMASAMTLGGNFYGFNGSATPEAADLRAMAADWIAVGNDIERAIDQVKSEVAETERE